MVADLASELQTITEPQGRELVPKILDCVRGGLVGQWLADFHTQLRIHRALHPLHRSMTLLRPAKLMPHFISTTLLLFCRLAWAEMFCCFTGIFASVSQMRMFWSDAERHSLASISL